MNVFTPIKPQRVYAQIVEQIIDLIKRGEFPVGTQLPPERDLAQRLGVSRASVREALTALQILGLVETKSGQGTFVCARDISPFFHPGGFGLGEFYADDESPFAILQARKTIEPPIAALAAQQCSDESLKLIEAIQDMVEADLGHVHIFREGDRRFHLAIAEITGNPVCVRVMSIIYELMGQKLWTALRDSAFTTTRRLQEYEGQHRAVYEAIKARDAQAAAARMREHLESVEQLMVEAELVPGAEPCE
jgi:GntR family transcriptional repressor for pyruvate dehydrogenase complex